MECHRGKMVICVIVTLWSILLLKDTQTFEHKLTNDKWSTSPSLQAFENYEKTIHQDDPKNLRQFTNDLENGYGSAPNFLEEGSEKFLTKRGTESLTNPDIYKFELQDAREPDDATRQLIEKHRARKLQQIEDVSSIGAARRRRDAPNTEPEFIKFEISDAVDPDDNTRELIRETRARKQKKTRARLPSTTPRSTKRRTTRKRKRTGRSTSMQEPQFIRFELEDAREPAQDFKELMQQTKEHEVENENNYPPTTELVINDTQTSDEDSMVEGSKRFYYYEAPPTKVKRVSNAIPSEINKVIQMMIKDKESYYKYKNLYEAAKAKSRAKITPMYMPSQMQASPTLQNLMTLYPEQTYVQKIIPVPVNVMTAPIQPQHNIQNVPSLVIPEVVNIQPQYQPVPISVSVPVPEAEVNVYPKPMSYVKLVPTMPSIYHQMSATGRPIITNEIPKENQYAKIIPFDQTYRYGKEVKMYPTSETVQVATSSGNTHSVILDASSTADVPTNSPNDHHGVAIYNKGQHSLPSQQSTEYQELSALVGKSPSDQIHGLAYLLAKEMQRSKQNEASRPQDNTSPILFHPERANSLTHYQPFPIPQPILEESSRQYTPIREQNSPDMIVTSLKPELEPSSTVPTSYAAVKAVGLSPNYKGVTQIRESSPLHSDNGSLNGLQYASKYAFGYRVRDFHSGNDFGHKQNRDLDGVTRGQYHILLPDGRVQNVIYHADDTGFHADVIFEAGHH